MNQAALHRLMASRGQKEPESVDQNKLFELRLAVNLSLIKNLFFTVYPLESHKGDFENLLARLSILSKERPLELKLQDINRLEKGNWYQSEQLIGMQLYVDLFNTDLKGLQKKIPYFKKLGINFLHLMPITPRPRGENDGGYAVNDYVAVDKKFGSKTDLLSLTEELRSNNIAFMLDFVVNHTSDEFLWAKKAMAGDSKYQNYYYTFPDRKIPDEFEKTMPQIFPETAPGNFTYNSSMQRWVMTVFNKYQWDLNYTNPEVFIEMLTNLLRMVNQGIDVIRLDALAFLWKKIGTDSQNLPEAHALIALFRMCLQVIAPGTVFLAEAIVAPNEIIKYFGDGVREGNECEIAYNATLMALLWNSIATKKTLLLRKNLWNIPRKPMDSTWINYIRCHDDIGLGFDDRYIYELGRDAKLHRKFLLDYYCHGLDWSPAHGELFMFNPTTGDGRITGSAASLLGLEYGLQKKDNALINTAIDKIVLLHAIILSYGGIPMIYAGDEIGTLNDYSYLEDKNKKNDSRWINRPKQDWEIVSCLDEKKSAQSKIFFALKKLIALRKRIPVFADNNNLIIYDCPNPHVLVYERTATAGKSVLIICNFDTHVQKIEEDWFREIDFPIKKEPKNYIDGKTIKAKKDGKFVLRPYQIFWLEKA
ncbi:MAG: amylosucrase [Saonia sp.]